MRFKLILSLLLSILIFQSCFWKEAGYWHDDQISSSDRSNFHELDDKLLKALKDDDPKELSFIESGGMIGNSYSIRQADNISYSFKTTDYKLLSEYYVVNKYKTYDTIVNKTKGLNNYKLVYGGATHEMYIAFFLPEKGRDKYMITAVFCNLNYGWKLSELDYNLYTINGLTSPELYQRALAEYKKHELINAYSDIQLAHYCMRPGDIWLYLNENEINNFYNQLTAEAGHNIKLPVVLNQVPTHPKVFMIFNKEYNDGYYPGIYYQSTIKLSDTMALRKENDQVMKVLPPIFPGIDKGKSYLLFTVFNKMPNMSESVDRYEMDNKLK